MTAPADEQTFRVRAYGAVSRAVVAVLALASAASLPFILLFVLTATDPPVTPPVLARMVLELTVLPGVLASMVAATRTATLRIHPGELVIERRGLRVEVPRDAVVAVEPWHIPLPAPGFVLRLRSGRRLAYRIGCADPAPLLGALAAAGFHGATRAASHPTVVWARARRSAQRRWYHLVVKFAGFGLLPTAVLFNAHQHIAHGALLGEYYSLGLASYVQTFLVYWATVTTYLVLYASMWRGVAEAVALAAAAVTPDHAVRVRRGVELVCAFAYYGGVPGLLAWRFLQ
jgi:hypothetical protein